VSDDELIAAYDPYDENVRRDPYPYYRAMREQCPVHHLERFDMYTVSRWDAVIELYRRHDLYTSTQGPGPEPFLALADMGLLALANADQPLHSKQRRLVNWAYTPRRVAALEPVIEAISHELINGFCERGSAEFVSEYAFQLPITVSAELFGIPPEDREQLKDWTIRLVGGLTGDAEGMGEAMRSMMEFAAYILGKANERQAMLDAGQEPPDDLLTALVQAEIDGEKLDEMELVMIAMQVINGGESSIGMLANIIHLLVTHPAELAKLRANPDLIDNVVEEVLRFEPPIQGLCRTTNEDAELEGVAIPAGKRVCALYAGANRDPEHWGPDAEEFRIDRDRSLLRTQLSFGTGIHFCVGASLARMEGQIFVRHMLERLPDIALDDSEAPIKRDDPLFFRGWHTLQIRFTPTPVRATELAAAVEA
jgi:cytochrome P450